MKQDSALEQASLAMILPYWTRRQGNLLLAALLILLCTFTYYATSGVNRHYLFAGRHRLQTPQDADASFQIPSDYRLRSPESDWCQDRVGLRYLEKARDYTASYCQEAAKSTLDCFWSKTADSRIDSMCYGTHAVYNSEKKKFNLHCPLRELAPEEADKGLPRVPDDLTSYWYETGPRQVVDNALELDGPWARRAPARTTVLLKREGTHNLWHSLMEIMSLSWTLDLLQMSGSEAGTPYISPYDMNTTQVVLIDNYELGPYIDLWQLFARMPIRHISELSEDEPPSNIVIPFAGGSNPVWQGDWTETTCTDSPLLNTFVGRVLHFYDIKDPAATEDVVVTFVDRTGSRRLLEQDSHIAALRDAIPHMKLDVVDFSKLALREQIEAARRTDVLVGAHGAGLTHSLFMKPGSAVVEVLPVELGHKGFRNLAQMLGHTYVRTHADAPPDTTEPNWQNDPVQIEKQRLIDAVKVGVEAMFSRGPRSYDVS